MTVSGAIFADWDVSSKIVAFTTTRDGGVSKPPYSSFNLATHVGDDPAHVHANRGLLQEQFPDHLTWQWLNQVHGTDVAVIERVGPEPSADAVLTRRSGLVCCVQTADCLPLLVAAVDGSEVAAIHAGWKGLASGVIESTIARLSTPAVKLAVWLGPAIGPCHFEVGAEVRDCFQRASKSLSEPVALQSCFTPSQNSGRYMADLYAIARLRLTALGVREISGGEYCTHCNETEFYSYRRDAVTGRMLNAIYIEA